MNQMILLRHGETEWSRDGRHTGRTDLPLTARGEGQARALAPLVDGRAFDLVLVSPARRARDTADLAGLRDYETDPDLWEWDYGGYEGITTPSIRETRPGWYLWRDGVVPGDTAHPGESAEQVGARADRVIARARAVAGDVALVAHGHFLRVLCARWLGLPPQDGRLFRLDTGTYSRLGFEHGEPVTLTWNAPV
ncbi:putative phosphoglycerate mutase [Streptosporangium becharense]|uniref:Putative phosphoglycerate mutase n=1 Tax=Streptosporangium becharense TaxID=1816182 RepID=A0A7W9ID68_9ACTN|nr:histidine phosphatase family protein [Streptosporangium becharense]MBB2912007.1 putative phosphoglycerate mutase [Streptosporangium becharense]MBB5818554.1 putative phosphoglycerate mutase [Streptosporangium becharense]